ncbi:hypothetical protein [Terrimonas sp.]|uniref:hypothetical protein n=1 Tax=Terrimonas sp. TaxID=1914338 RepID=UPI001402BC0C|nr:hypothetical protein [Terrimonas sp.]
MTDIFSKKIRRKAVFKLVGSFLLKKTPVFAIAGMEHKNRKARAKHSFYCEALDFNLD